MYKGIQFAEEFGLKNSYRVITLLNSTSSHFIFCVLCSTIMQTVTVESKVLTVSEELRLLKHPGEIGMLFKFHRTHEKYTRVCYPSCYVVFM